MKTNYYTVIKTDQDGFNILVSFVCKSDAISHSEILEANTGKVHQVVPCEITLFLPVAELIGV